MSKISIGTVSFDPISYEALKASIDGIGTYYPPFFKVANPDGDIAWEGKATELLEKLYMGLNETAQVSINPSSPTAGQFTIEPSKGGAFEVLYSFAVGTVENP